MANQTPEVKLFDLLSRASSFTPTAPSEGSEVEKVIAKDDPDYGTPVTVRNLFTHNDTHPVVLNLALMKLFGKEWIGWEPQTIWAEINRLFKSQISEHNRAKIQSLIVLNSHDGFWKSWHVFEKIVQALNGNIPTWSVMQVPTAEQLYVAIDMVDHIARNDFSDEVKLYMTAVILNDELTYVPPPLDFIQVEVSQPFYRCTTCSQQVSALFHDKFCDSCTKKFSPEQGLSLSPKSDTVSRGVGMMTEHVTHDPSEVSDRWEQVKSQPADKVSLKDNPVDHQVAQLLVCRDVMNIRRRQLSDQLTSLKSWLTSPGNPLLEYTP